MISMALAAAVVSCGVLAGTANATPGDDFNTPKSEAEAQYLADLTARWGHEIPNPGGALQNGRKVCDMAGRGYDRSDIISRILENPRIHYVDAKDMTDIALRDICPGSA